MTMAFFAGGRPGIWEIILILVVVLILFGAKRLPELSRSLGKSLGEFKKGREEGDRKDDPPEDKKKGDNSSDPKQKGV